MRSLIRFWAILALVGFAAGGRCLAEPPAAAPADNANAFDAVAKDIVDSVQALGYPKVIGDDLVHLVRDWQCERWRQAIAQARLRSAGKHSAEVARLEEDAIRSLYLKLGKEIAPCDPLDRKQMNRDFYLPEVLKDKKAQCLGYSQLYYVLGKAIGLRVQVIDVLELASGPLPVEDAHVACLVDRSDGKVMIVDAGLRYVSWPFVFREEYAEAGNYWRLKHPGNLRALYRQIEIVNEAGITAEVYNNLAHTYGLAGQLEQALSYYTKATELNPKCAEAFCNRGNAQRVLGQNQQAIADFDKAIELNPQYAAAFNARGAAKLAMAQSEQALADFTKAIELSPKMADAFNNRGNLHSSLRQYEQALADYTKVIELNPTLADPFNNRGFTYSEAGQFAQAIPDYTKAIEIDPRHDKAYFNRAVAYANLGKTAEAKKDLKKAAELNPAASGEIKAISDKFKLGL
jgi:tetratricopeptide (TPR) repeat protein